MKSRKEEETVNPLPSKENFYYKKHQRGLVSSSIFLSDLSRHLCDSEARYHMAYRLM